jgi:hypothetical protein
MKPTNKRTRPQRREHLFSPHTDQCVYCGKSAVDDAIENTPCGCDDPLPCEACGGKGWLLADDAEHGLHIERCDACQQFANDQIASEAMEKAAQAQPALLKFVEEIAGLKHEKDPDDAGNLSEGPSEDFIVTLNQLILEARQLLGTADKCDVCGEAVPYVIGCPGGAEVCQACFDAGQLHASGL